MYYIIETQENKDGTASVLPVQIKTSREEALSVWHSILSFAATSQIYIHSAIVLDSELKVVATETFKHIPPIELIPEVTQEESVDDASTTSNTEDE